MSKTRTEVIEIVRHNYIVMNGNERERQRSALQRSFMVPVISQASTYILPDKAYIKIIFPNQPSKVTVCCLSRAHFLHNTYTSST